MSTIDHTRLHERSRRAAAGTARRRSVELVSDGVVAAYIHDISRRHARPPAHAGARATCELSGRASGEDPSSP